MTSIWLSTHLRGYTNKQADVWADGNTLAELLLDLERQYRGIRFRMIDEQDQIRQHMMIFINKEKAVDLSAVLKPTDRVRIIGALSGG